MMTRTVLSGGYVYDGTLAEPTHCDIAITDGRIVELGTGLDGDIVIDVTGQWISPGFMDCHVHLTQSGYDFLAMAQRPFSLPFYQAIGNMQATLEAGITTVRDAGGADLGVKEAVAQGLIRGPRLQIAITMLSQTGGHNDDWMVCGSSVALNPPHPGKPSGIVDGPAEVRKRVRELIRAGADVIKVATSGGVLSPRDVPTHAHFRDDEIRTMVDEATAAGISVMSHAQGTAGIKAAIRCGVRSIEHGIYLDDEAIDLMVARGVYLVPTLHAPRAVLANVEAGMAYPQAVVDKAYQVRSAHDDSVRRAIAAGVPIAMGTDCGVGQHGTNLTELALLTDLGMTPRQALQAATGTAARLLGVQDDRGTIDIGMRADLVVLNGSYDVATDLRTQVQAVFQDGQLVAGRL